MDEFRASGGKKFGAILAALLCTSAFAFVLYIASILGVFKFRNGADSWIWLAIFVTVLCVAAMSWKNAIRMLKTVVKLDETFIEVNGNVIPWEEIEEVEKDITHVKGGKIELLIIIYRDNGTRKKVKIPKEVSGYDYIYNFVTKRFLARQSV